MANAPDPALAFCEYAQQVLGVPWATLSDQKVLRKKANEFFRHYPHTDWYTLCRIVIWAKAKRRRFGRVQFVIEAFRDAYVAGAIPELDQRRHDETVEDDIARALAIETDPAWRVRLISTSGVELRRQVLDEWAAAHAR